MKRLLPIALLCISALSHNALANNNKSASMPDKPPTQSSEQIQRININSADAKELAKLPGIGMKKAAAIVAYRDEHGSFNRIEDLVNVKGIGKASMRKLSERISI